MTPAYQICWYLQQWSLNLRDEGPCTRKQRSSLSIETKPITYLTTIRKQVSNAIWVFQSLKVRYKEAIPQSYFAIHDFF